MPCKVKRENLVSLPLTGAACETVEIVDPGETDALDQTHLSKLAVDVRGKGFGSLVFRAFKSYFYWS